MSAVQLAFKRSWRVLLSYGIFTAWGLGCLVASVMLTLGAQALPAVASTAALTLGGIVLATVLGHVVGNALAMLRLRLWLVALLAGFVAIGVAIAMAAGPVGGFVLVGALAALGGYFGVASRMEIFAAWLPLTYAVGAAVLWMNTHGRVSVWLTGAKFAVWDALTFSFLSGAVLLFLVFLMSRHALALTLWRDAARPGARGDDAVAKAGRGSFVVLLGLAGVVLVATAAVSPFLFRSEANAKRVVKHVHKHHGSYSTTYSAGAPPPITYDPDAYVDYDWGTDAPAYATDAAVTDATTATVAPAPKPKIPPPNPVADPCAPGSKVTLACFTKLNVKGPDAPPVVDAAPDTAVRSTTPQPIYSKPQQWVAVPSGKHPHTAHHTTHASTTAHASTVAHAGTHAASTHAASTSASTSVSTIASSASSASTSANAASTSATATAASNANAAGTHASATSANAAGTHASATTSASATGANAATASATANAAGANAATAAGAHADASAGEPIVDATDLIDDDGAGEVPQPDIDHAAEAGAVAAKIGLFVLFGLVAGLVLVLAVASVFFRPLRRAFLLRHLEKPRWSTTPTRRIQNLWLRALIALDDLGVAPSGGDESPEKLADRARAHLHHTYGDAPGSISDAAAIIERLDYAGRGLAPGEERAMKEAVTDLLAYAATHLTAARKVSLGWAPIRTA